MGFLYIVDRPEIATQPQNDTRTEGRNVTLTCNATGNPERGFFFRKSEHFSK